MIDDEGRFEIPPIPPEALRAELVNCWRGSLLELSLNRDDVAGALSLVLRRAARAESVKASILAVRAEVLRLVPPDDVPEFLAESAALERDALYIAEMSWAAGLIDLANSIGSKP